MCNTAYKGLWNSSAYVCRLQPDNHEKMLKNVFTFIQRWGDGGDLSEEGELKSEKKLRGRKPIETYFDGKYHWDKDGNKYHIDARGYRVKYKYKIKGPGERKPRGRPRIQNMDDRKIITLEETLYHFPQKGETDLTKRFQCDRCVRKFELEEDYKQHVHRHEVASPDKAFTCFYCSDNKMFSNEEDYLAHLQGYFFIPTFKKNCLSLSVILQITK